MRGSTHSLHEENFDRSENQCKPQESALFGFYLKLIIILWSGVRIPSPLPKIQPRFSRGLIFGIWGLETDNGVRPAAKRRNYAGSTKPWRSGILQGSEAQRNNPFAATTNFSKNTGKIRCFFMKNSVLRRSEQSERRRTK